MRSFASQALSSSQIARLVRGLESLTAGELAVDLLIAAGERSILPLEEFLLGGKARTVIICAATVGFRVAPQEEFRGIVSALFRVAPKLNWLQEDEVVHLLDEHKVLADCEANRVLTDLRERGEQVSWLSATWRILGHLGRLDLEKRENDVA
jgi:hypothetical protein